MELAVVGAELTGESSRVRSIPGTKRVSRVEENTAADGIELSEEQIERLNDLTPAAGERHEEANMASVDRWLIADEQPILGRSSLSIGEGLSLS